MDRPPDRPRTRPLRFKLTLAAVVAMGVLGWQIIDAYRDYTWSGKQLPSIARMQKAEDEITRLDEVLRSSARMAAASGKPEWEARYRESAPQMDELIEQAAQMETPTSRGSMAAASAAHAALGAIDRRMFELVRQGDLEAARHLLSSDEHEVQRRIYAEGISGYSSRLLLAGQAVDDALRNDVFWNTASNAAVAVFLIFGLWTAYRATRRWHAVIRESNWQLNQKSDELAESNRQLDRKVSERTQELNDSVLASLNMMEDAVLQREKATQAYVEIEQTHKQLLEASRLAGMSEVATNVLHNVGNVLNSVNISASLVADSIKGSRAASLAQVVTMLRDHAADLGSYITADPRGRHIPDFLEQLAQDWQTQQQGVIGELESLRANIDHIKQIVAMQQGYAKVAGATELVNVVDLVENCLRMNESALARHQVRVVREFDAVPAISVQKHKVLQILVNLMRNAKNACDESVGADRRMTLGVHAGAGRIFISVSDNGVGIAPENLRKIFVHGFTTRKDGHGFGLHSGALAATELGGSLRVHSDGLGQGATFTLDLPAPGAMALA